MNLAGTIREMGWEQPGAGQENRIPERASEIGQERPRAWPGTARSWTGKSQEVDREQPGTGQDAVRGLDRKSKKKVRNWTENSRELTKDC
jgi:hypothetical protein